MELKTFSSSRSPKLLYLCLVSLLFLNSFQCNVMPGGKKFKIILFVRINITSKFVLAENLWEINFLCYGYHKSD